MSDLINRIREAKVRAAEAVVVAHLEASGLGSPAAPDTSSAPKSAQVGALPEARIEVELLTTEEVNQATEPLMRRWASLAKGHARSRAYEAIQRALIAKINNSRIGLVVKESPPASAPPGWTAEAEKDAARYRWLRQHKHYALLIGKAGFGYAYAQVEHWSNAQNGTKLDAAIDAAMLAAAPDTAILPASPGETT